MPLQTRRASVGRWRRAWAAGGGPEASLCKTYFVPDLEPAVKEENQSLSIRLLIQIIPCSRAFVSFQEKVTKSLHAVPFYKKQLYEEQRLIF